MKENDIYRTININNKNNFNINNEPIQNIKISNTTQKEYPKFSDILSISSNPEEIFTLLYPLGHGGFGTVYKAIHKETKTIYAIKIIDFIHGLKNISLHNSALKNNFKNLIFNYNYSSAEQESSLMKLCHKSNYIVNYYGSYYSKKTNTLWLILEYCHPGSVVDLMLAMNRTYTEQEISTIMKDVLNGLILIHSKNLIHRDIKAANIFLSEDGFAKLGDFGVGAKLGIGDYFRNSKKGSPYWMSPQVVKNLNYDMKTDIWSLGITCCEMSNGEPPFAELNPKNVMEKIGNNPPKVDEVIKKGEHTKEFFDFVKKCLEVDPEKRPNAEELIKHEFIRKYSKDNIFLKELIKEHIDDVNKFRKRNQNKEENNNKNIIQMKSHHERNSGSNITSHFNEDIKPLNDFKEKENLLIKMISSSENMDNNINSTKDSQNQIKEEITSKKDYKNFPTFHKIEEDNINDDSDSFEVQEIHNLNKSFDKNYFLKENNNNGNLIKLTKYNKDNKKERINLLLDMDEIKSKINQEYFFNINNNNIFNKKQKNDKDKKIITKKIKPKSRNIINKSSDNLYIKNTKSYINNNLTNFVYIKSKIKKRQKNNFVFKKPIISFKTKNCFFAKTINIKKLNNYLLLDKEDEEGHINNTNLFNTKSNFDLLKNANNDFSKTNYCFYKRGLQQEENKIYKSNSNKDINN